MSLEGDFGKLEKLNRKLSRAERELLEVDMQDPLEAEAKSLYQESFARQEGPIGGPWAESPNSMVQSGDLSEPSVSFKGKTLEVGTGAYYGIFHQGGWQTHTRKRVVVDFIPVAFNIKTRKLSKFKTKTKSIKISKDAGPARPILPSKSDAGDWEAPLQKTIESVIRRHFSE